MSPPLSLLRDLCRMLGGLTLDGANAALLAELRDVEAAARLSADAPAALAEALRAMHGALAAEEPDAIAVDYTRLLLADGETGARKPVLVPPWEDCYTGHGRVVMGPRSQAALRAYAGARLGFDGMIGHPADHIGLELCFVAALLDEEERGERGTTVRAAFVADHLKSFAPAFGKALTWAARTAFWREVGRAVEVLPEALCAAAPSAAG